MAKSVIDFKKLETLVELKSNDEIKITIKQTDASKLTDGCGMTMVHLAAKHNNVELLEYLLAQGFDFKSKNIRGTSPALMAAMYGNAEALSILLNADDNIFKPVQKGKTFLQIIFDKNHGIEANIISEILKHLRKKSFTVKETVRELTKTNCPLDSVLLMKDAEVTAMMLMRLERIMSLEEYYSILKSAFNLEYMDNVKAIIDHGQGDYASMSGYVNNLCNIVENDSEAAKIFVEQMANWDLYKHYWLISALCCVFKENSKEVVKFFIDCGVPEQVKKKYGFDLVAYVFENDNFEASELLEDIKFNVNAINMQKSRILWIAAAKGSEKNMEFLLKRGADPNLTDKNGMTLMHHTQLVEYVILLLKYGADIQIVGQKNQTIFDKYDEDTKSVQLAHLAMIESQGVIVKKEIQNKINDDSEMKHLFEKCRWQLEQMKDVRICQKITLHTMLFGKIEGFLDCMKSQLAVNMILNWCQQSGVHDYYTLILEEKLSEAAKMYDLRWKASKLVADCMDIYHPGHQVVKMILGYLELKDLELLGCHGEDFLNDL